mgnify:FL=1
MAVPCRACGYIKIRNPTEYDFFQDYCFAKKFDYCVRNNRFYMFGLKQAAELLAVLVDSGITGVKFVNIECGRCC